MKYNAKDSHVKTHNRQPTRTTTNRFLTQLGCKIEIKEIFDHNEDREGFLAEPVKGGMPLEKTELDIGPEKNIVFEKEIGKVNQPFGFA